MDRNKIKEHLLFEEGFVPHVYKDSLGYDTIGIGRLVDGAHGGGITKDEALFLLGNDIDRTSAQLYGKIPWLKSHPEDVQTALMSMAFQMGIGGLLGFKNTLALIQAKEYNKAADNALKSTWAKQTPARAKRVTDMIRNAK